MKHHPPRIPPPRVHIVEAPCRPALEPDALLAECNASEVAAIVRKAPLRFGFFCYSTTIRREGER